MDFLNEYTPLILSSIAIIIAIWSSRSTTKDTRRQIKSIRELAKTQMRISIVILDAEIKKNRLLALQAENEWKEIEAIYKDPGGQIYPPYRNEKLSRIKNEKPKNDLLFYKNYLRELNDSLSTLDSIKKSMD